MTKSITVSQSPCIWWHLLPKNNCCPPLFTFSWMKIDTNVLVYNIFQKETDERKYNRLTNVNVWVVLKRPWLKISFTRFSLLRYWKLLNSLERFVWDCMWLLWKLIILNKTFQDSYSYFNYFYHIFKSKSNNKTWIELQKTKMPVENKSEHQLNKMFLTQKEGCLVALRLA